MCSDTPAENQDEFYKSTDFEMKTREHEKAKFLQQIERFVRFEVQRHRDDLVKRIDQKIAELWSAFDNFTHNFHLDRDYRLRNYSRMDNDETETVVTELLSDLTCPETKPKSKWN